MNLFRVVHPSQGFYHQQNNPRMPIAEFGSKVEAKVQRDKLNPARTEEHPHSVGPWHITYGPEHRNA